MINISFRDLGRVGRLGNALYQLAATAGIADTMGVEPRFNADWIHRPYFSVPDRFFVDDWSDERTVEAQRTFSAQHIDERVRVYLQDVGLFAGILPTIREWLAPSERALEIMAKDPEVTAFEELPGPVLSIHVRRGDNVVDPGVPNKSDYHICPPLAYYESALQLALERHPDIQSVACFSDDIEWCEAQPGLERVDFFRHGVSRPKEHEADYLTAPVLDQVDLFLQARCQHHVVTGSTFGIWGALLAGDESAVYYRPVYGRLLRFIDESLLFPPAWVLHRG